MGSAAFDDCYFAFGEYAAYGYAALGFEVVAEDEAACLVEAYGAVGEDYFVAVGVDFGGVGHEGCFACGGLYEHHGEEGLEVAFASGHDACVVEEGEGHAACGAGALEEAEACEGDGGEVFFFYYAAEGLGEAHGFGDVGGGGLDAVFGAVGEVGACVGYLVVGDVVVDVVDAFEGYGYEFYAPAFAEGLGVDVAGDEPVGGSADDAYALAGEFGADVVEAAELDEACGYLGGCAVDYFAGFAACAEEGCYLEGCGEGVVGAVGYEECGVGECGEGFFDLAFYAACGDEECAEGFIGECGCLVGAEDVDFVEVFSSSVMRASWEWRTMLPSWSTEVKAMRLSIM